MMELREKIAKLIWPVTADDIDDLEAIIYLRKQATSACNQTGK